jgi:hypothetical protein
MEEPKLFSWKTQVAEFHWSRPPEWVNFHGNQPHHQSKMKVIWHQMKLQLQYLQQVSAGQALFSFTFDLLGVVTWQSRTQPRATGASRHLLLWCGSWPTRVFFVTPFDAQYIYICFFIYLFIYLYLYLYLCIDLFICLFIYLFLDLYSYMYSYIRMSLYS